MRVCQGDSRLRRDRARTRLARRRVGLAVSALRVLIADASADPVDRRPAGAGNGTRGQCARWRAPSATPGRASCWCPRGTLARAGGTGGGWRTGWRAPAARAGPPGCKGAVLVRALAAPGSAAALTGWTPRLGAAALCIRHAEWAGGASLASSPAAACRKPGGARLLLFVAALRVQPASDGRTAGSLLPLPPPFRRRLRCFGRSRTMGVGHENRASLYAEVTGRVVASWSRGGCPGCSLGMLRRVAV
jgi:hypothetical protein